MRSAFAAAHLSCLALVPCAIRLQSTDDDQPMTRPAVLEPVEDPPDSQLEPAYSVDWDSPDRGPATDADLSAFSAAGGEGEVDFLYTFGAPGAASPGLWNQRNDNGCFGGLRAYQTQSLDWAKWVDLVTRIGNYIGYAHAKISTVEIDITNPVFAESDCEDESYMWHPRGIFWGSAALHMQQVYITNLGVMGEAWLQNVSIFAANEGYIQEPQLVAQNVKPLGWRLVGSALHPGGWVYGGKQISHLFQHPDTLECMITFQGTASFQGWVSNFDWLSTHFCGLSDRDESCRFRIFGCNPRNPRGAFVHSGFSGRLRVMAKSNDWQHNIHRFLPSCRKVHVTGHSLGGSMAELFTACASNAPKPDQFGWEDYKWIGWKTGTPAVLPYLD